jgi:tight adherence protein B
MSDSLTELVDAAAVAGMLRAGLSPREAFTAVGWGEPGEDGAPVGIATSFAVAARLAHGTGAALAPVLEACAVAVRAEAEAELARDIALAGPRLSARVLAWLPLVGLGFAVLVDASVVRVFATPLGIGLLAVGAALTLAGRLWMRRLVARAYEPPSSAVLTLHAVRAAMAAGADVASALAAVSLALTPQPGCEGVGELMRAVALALARGEPWETAWRESGVEAGAKVGRAKGGRAKGGRSAPGSALQALERALRLPWERGAHAGPLLTAVADGEQLLRRREAQVAAGELAVRLTLPLAVCLLPAFVVVGIVPLLAALIGGLQ